MRSCRTRRGVRGGCVLRPSQLRAGSARPPARASPPRRSSLEGRLYGSVEPSSDFSGRPKGSWHAEPWRRIATFRLHCCSSRACGSSAVQEPSTGYGYTSVSHIPASPSHRPHNSSFSLHCHRSQACHLGSAVFLSLRDIYIYLVVILLF